MLIYYTLADVYADFSSGSLDVGLSISPEFQTVVAKVLVGKHLLIVSLVCNQKHNLLLSFGFLEFILSFLLIS